MTTSETKQLVLDIAMNCHRIGGWIADDYVGKKKRIDTFLFQTREYVRRFETAQVPASMVTTRQLFSRAFDANVRELIDPASEKMAVAERFMTWGNILTHRAKVL